MKSAKMLTILVMALALMVCLPEVSKAAPMGTAWTYQGRLIDANGPADGIFEFEFKLYDSPAGGNQLDSSFSLRGVDVIDGYFTVELDFGSDVFDGDVCWLEIGVRAADAVDPFTTLSPRQRMAPTPYALQTRGIFVDGDPYVSDYPGTWTPKESNRMWRSIAMSADGTKQTAVAAFGQIYISMDSGYTWTAKESNRFWTSVAMSADGTKQTAVGNNIQIYVSTDSGNTWTAKESNRYWNSVAMSADGTKQTAVGQNTLIYVSLDSGGTWTGKDFFRSWQSVAMSADGTKQTAVVLGGQIYVSTDSGNTWGAKESNRQWASVAMSADGTKQTAAVYNGQIYVSTDSGNTWTAKESNRGWQSVAMSVDGTKQTAVVNNGQVYVSTDSGNTWTATESNRAWMSVAMSADGTKHTAVVDQGQIYICSVVVSYSYNVGIGTTNPSGSLHPDSTTLEIAGNAPSIVLDDQWGIAQDDFEISNGGDKVLFRNATDGLDILTIGIAGDVEGWVGIGTTSPARPLHIQDSQGSIRIDRDENCPSVYMVRTAPGNFSTVWKNFGLGTSADGEGSGHFFIADMGTVTGGAGTERIHIDNEGNVGIGMDIPSQKLDVSGNINYSGQLTKLDVADNFVATVRAGDFLLGHSSRHGSPGRALVDNTDALVLNFGGDWIRTGIHGATTYIEGKVGIGTENPADKLHVSGGEIRIDYAMHEGIEMIQENGFTTDIDTVGNDLMIKNYATGHIMFSTSTTPLSAEHRLVIKNDGNIGIGTTSPAKALDVNGMVRIRNFPTVGILPTWNVKVDTNGDLFKDTSSRRYKKEIRELQVDPQSVCALRPVEFEWKGSGDRDIGLIAEEVDEVIGDLVVHDRQGRPDAVKYDKLAVYLLQVVKAQQQEITELKERICQTESLRQRLEAVEKMVGPQEFASMKEVQQ